MAAKRRTLTATTAVDDGAPPRHHFFASSAATWRVGYDVAELVAALRREGLPFNVFMVPGSKDDNYDINFFTPQVEGTTFLAHYGVA